MDVKGVSSTRPLIFKLSISPVGVVPDPDLQLGRFSTCAANVLAAMPAPRLWPHKTSFESGGYLCETQSTTAAASRVIPLSEGRPREVQNPRYERATMVYVGESSVLEQADRPLRTSESPGRRGGKEEPLLVPQYQQ